MESETIETSARVRSNSARREVKKVGILTFHRCVNYGAYWQVRCFSDYLTRLGFEPQVLDYGWRGHIKSEIKHALRPSRSAPVGDIIRNGIKALKCFRAQQGIRRTPSFPLHNPPDFSDFDLIAVGSDEVWNLSHPWLGKAPLFFGEKLAPKRLVSYAASFGNYPAANGLSPEAVRRLQRFDRISVRDKNSVELIERNVGRSPTLVIDPCLLAEKLEHPQPAHTGQGYVLVYGTSFLPELISETRAWARARNLRVVSIGYRNDWADELMLTAGPHDFVRMFQNATAVVTTYFHGCVFSLRCTRPFVAQLSKYRSNKVEGLLSAVGALHRIYDVEKPGTVEPLLKKAIEPEVLANIAAIRAVSEDYLQTCIQF
jgi:hypothetical protein